MLNTMACMKMRYSNAGLTRWLGAIVLSLWCAVVSTAEVLPSIDQEIDRVSALFSDEQNTLALADALQLQDRANESGTSEQQARVLSMLAEFYVNHGNPRMGLETVNDGLGIDVSLDVDVRTELTVVKTMSLVRLGRFELAQRWAEEVIRLASLSGDDEMLGMGTYLLASTYARLNRPDDAVASYRKAATILKAGGYFDQYMRAVNDLAMLQKFRGEYQASLQLFNELLPFAQAMNDQMVIVYALLEIGDVNRLLGNLSEAETVLLQVDRIIGAESKPQWEVFVHTYLADLYRQIGDVDTALKHNNELATHQAAVQTENAVARAAELEFKRMATEHQYQMALLDKEREIAEIAARSNRAVLVAVLFGMALLSLGVTWMYRRMREQSRANEALRASNRWLDEVARTDALTGMANRHALAERVARLQRRRIDYAMILMDIDHFKQINDKFGHDHGDAVLIEFAHRIQTRIRRTDLGVRWGGEEFLILLPETSQAEAHDVAQQIHAFIRREAIIVDGHHHRVTATFGIACVAGHDDFEAVFKSADEALNLGKREGRDRVATTDISATGSTRSISLVASAGR
ncbi:MAG: tetratricopeptide repeat-containing diguanylate cyclase [Pseudomonadota bacterium]